MNAFDPAAAEAAGLLVEAEGEGAERVTLNRPHRLNSIHQPLAEALLGYFESRRRREDLRVIVLRAEGKAFCAGADLKSFGTSEELRDGPDGDWVLRDLVRAMRACPQPIICTVQGAAAGAGLALALASDVVVMCKSAAFHPAFINVGLSGAELGVSWWLQRVLGPYRARQMLLTGRPLPAPEAFAAGLVSTLVADGEQDAAAEALAADMLKARPDALRLTKRGCDAALAAGNLDTALELEERAQMLMIARGGRPAL